MGEIPVQYFPPKGYYPEKIFALPELRYPKKLNLGALFVDGNVERRPNKTAILYKEEKITYKELSERINRLGNVLKSLGVRKQDRVMIRGPNIPEYIISTLACWKIGAIVVVTPPILKAEGITYRANDSEATTILVSLDSLSEVDKAKDKLKTVRNIVVIRGEEKGCLSYEELVRGGSIKLEPEDTTKDDFGRIVYTSGTTGLPKGCVMTLGDILSVTDTHGKYVIGLNEDDVVGGHPAVTFNMGNVNFTMEPWKFGAAVSLIDDWTPEKGFEIIGKHKITILNGVPTAFRIMLDVEDAEKRYDLTSLRLCISAGETLTADTYLKWKKRFGIEILDHLGSSELHYFLCTHPNTPEDKAGSTGVPVPGYECKIVDESFREVPVGTVGTLFVRGPVGVTYWRKPHKQRELIYEGWSNTELLYREDEDGYFWYVSRVDDMIVTAGYKIPGGEVEKALHKHPAVLESAVVASPHDVRGNVVKAYIVLRNGYEPSKELVKTLQDFVKSGIAPYKYPRIIEFVKEIPKGPTGKISRKLLRDMEYEKHGGEEKKTVV